MGSNADWDRKGIGHRFHPKGYQHVGGQHGEGDRGDSDWKCRPTHLVGDRRFVAWIFVDDSDFSLCDWRSALRVRCLLFLIGAAETMREWIGSVRMRRLTKLVDSLTILVASNNARNARFVWTSSQLV